MLARIDHADPARSAEQAADAAADAAGVQLSKRFSIVEIWCPEAKRFEPARASGEKVLDDFHRSSCSLIHAYLANTAAAVYASGTCSVHESLVLTSAAAAAAAAAEDPLDSRLQASFLFCVTTVRAMSAALAQKDGPAHDAALNLAVAQQRGEAPPPTGQVALQIHEASRAAWASHLQWERIRRACCGDDAFHPHDDQERIVNSHGLRCCPRCDELRHQRPLRVGFVLDNATCWCYGPCQRPWPGPCTAGCEGPCECEASLEAGQTVWYCDSCYTCCERDEGYIVCSRCMGFGDDPFGHMVRVTALDSVRDTARVARQAFGFE